MRRSRKWYASSSRPILRSNEGIKHSKSTRLWRCGTHQEGVASTPTFFATRRCGEVGFGQYAISLQTGTVSMTGIGGNFQTRGTWESTSSWGQTLKSSLSICLRFSFTHLSNAWATTCHPYYFILLPSLVILALLIGKSLAMGSIIFLSLSRSCLGANMFFCKLNNSNSCGRQCETRTFRRVTYRYCTLASISSPTPPSPFSNCCPSGRGRTNGLAWVLWLNVGSPAESHMRTSAWRSTCICTERMGVKVSK